MWWGGRGWGGGGGGEGCCAFIFLPRRRPLCVVACLRCCVGLLDTLSPLQWSCVASFPGGADYLARVGVCVRVRVCAVLRCGSPVWSLTVASSTYSFSFLVAGPSLLLSYARIGAWCCTVLYLIYGLCTARLCWGCVLVASCAATCMICWVFCGLAGAVAPWRRVVLCCYARVGTVCCTVVLELLPPVRGSHCTMSLPCSASW